VKKNTLLNYLKWLWLAAVVIFIGYYFYKHLPQEIQYFKSINIGRLLLAALLVAAAKLFLVDMARLSISNDKWQPSYLRMFSIVTVTQLGKYIPGSIWHFAARVSSYKENELSNKKNCQSHDPRKHLAGLWGGLFWPADVNHPPSSGHSG
jgi:hypothetical protein